MNIKGVTVKGNLIDYETRCIHYHSPLDVIAIKFKCCEVYYPCYKCHNENTDHAIQVWEVHEFQEKAILCGMCGLEMTIHDYLQHGEKCQRCRTAFNPGCRLHRHIYFQE
ncbi:CHY zinc finger protein [Salirhabdus salicampi]|uniref:CHY zinc finger protein n=1 Tax=Salirhabdus salicampi TaxID=476102 RepID=UPI0020C1DA55|nr:CHY zinc finger protein [Salirhabdus salicampi]